jgi:predicted transcriptional regulator YheO
MIVEAPFERYIPIADMIVSTFGRNCEVVIHDFRKLGSSLIYISGSVTNRTLGAPTTNVILRELRRDGDEAEDKLGFTAQTTEGRTLKTSISYIRNAVGKVIGCMGVNYDITEFSLMNKILTEFSRTRDIETISESSSILSEHYANNIEEVFEHIINDSLNNIPVNVSEMSREDKIEFVRMIDEKGAFMIHGAIDKISDILRVSKQTIYNYLDEIRS